MKLNSLRLDRDELENGRWFTYIGDAEFLVGSMASKRFQLALSKKLGELGVDDVMDFKSLPADQKLAICDLIGEHVLLGWRNIQNDDGTEMEYTTQRSIDLCRDEECTHIVTFLLNKSAGVTNYLVARREQLAKN